ncbi:glycoside hydrolase family 2 TIM barrel-domain containing protein [Sediminitomix flava]|uniref:Glycosyl hydrolase family 2 n=1 Tax=Sediminitomix flava TaxID=379075 RepID=A0A315YYK0_SEDFL|nr:glycoside hydrolase family 2 TIM barrel-domain containing protein [Sediminitomix flava]PWJ34969.1 glycosyl hydrolase family 2 [Sediminitomix flava]
MKYIFILLFCFTSCSSLTKKHYSTARKPIKVELRQTDGKYQLYRAGEPYYVKGAGTQFGPISEIAKNGGNSFRTWSTSTEKWDGLAILDSAQKYGLTVLMGIEVARERHGFDYNDSVAVKAQIQRIKNEVTKLKDHPALLAWGIGNELNLHSTNLKVWNAVNDIAEMIHEVDVNHPVTTMLAGIQKKEVDYIKQHCQEIDFLSIQMYGGILGLQNDIDKAGWEGAYMVTEWGATGHWEVPQTEWGIAIEQTSSEKADAISERWDKAIISNQPHCLGSYVFLWGQKQERTPTWYGLFLKSGEATEVVDVMHKKWTGKEADNRAPRFDSLHVEGRSDLKNLYLKPNSDFKLEVFAHDPNQNDILQYRVEILPDQIDTYADGGDYEPQPEILFSSESVKNKFKVRSPRKKGAYRVFVYVFDGKGHAATANIPFYVKDESSI